MKEENGRHTKWRGEALVSQAKGERTKRKLVKKPVKPVQV